MPEAEIERRTSVCSRRTVVASLVALTLPGLARSTVATDSRTLHVIAAAIAQTRLAVTYDGSYRRIAYPNGDVPANIGVCTDVIIRAYRAIDVDLQQLVHEDMSAAFQHYPRLWGAKRPDPNIDHRRVPNLQTFFRRRGAGLPVGSVADRFAPGDLVTWMLPGNLPHIGLVIDRLSMGGERPLIVHNVGRGPQIEDVLFQFPMTGHYRFRPRSA
jgi:uncharacterized protein YijF (DUF1287 family)